MISRIIDLGLEDQSEDNITFLERDAPKISFSKCIDKVITEQQAKQAGKLLNDNRVISLIFLLLSNFKRAYEIARDIEKKKLSVVNGMNYGEAILLSLMSYAQNCQSWELKVMCALHLLKQYKAIMILNPRLGPGGSVKTRQEFDGKERFFIDPVRIELLNVCQDLKKEEARQVMINMGNVDCDWQRLETGFLHEMQTNGQECIFKMITSHLNRDVEMFTQRRGTKALQLKKGKLLIIALENYQTSGYSRREGTQPDIDALVRTFRKFGCPKKHIKVERDLTGDQLIPAMKRFNDFLNESGVDGIDFCVVCIIGHGRINGQTKQEEIVGIDGKGVPKELLEEIIIEAKNCPIMHGKPKIFLVQACRGMVDNETLRKEQKRQRKSGEEDSGIESCGIASDGNPEEVAQNSWHMTFQMTRILPRQVPQLTTCIPEELHFCKSS